MKDWTVYVCSECGADAVLPKSESEDEFMYCREHPSAMISSMVLRSDNPPKKRHVG